MNPPRAQPLDAVVGTADELAARLAGIEAVEPQQWIFREEAEALWRAGRRSDADEAGRVPMMRVTAQQSLPVIEVP